MLFLARFDEPAQGMDALMAALPALVAHYPDLELLIVGRGDEQALTESMRRPRRPSAGRCPTRKSASALRSADVYVRANTGGASASCWCGGGGCQDGGRQRPGRLPPVAARRWCGVLVPIAAPCARQAVIGVIDDGAEPTRW